MKILDAVPAQMVGRGHPDSVPVECDRCSTVFLWERRKGGTVRCPDCKTTATLELPQKD